MAGGHFVLKFSNPNVDAANYQIVDHDLASTTLATDAEALAQLIAFWQQTGFNSIAVGTNLVEATLYPLGGGAGVAQPFPVAAHAALVVIDPTLPPATAFPVDVGASSSGLAPLGTSIVVSEYTAVGGPGGRGRLFIPFVAEATVTAGGTLDPTIAATIATLYGHWIHGGTFAFGTEDLEPVIVHRNGDPATDVTHVKAQPVFSNLESRRR
jgi:hypothetical protein